MKAYNRLETKQTPFFLGMGKKQKQFIYRMANEGLVIKGVHISPDQRTDTFVTDKEGNNRFETIHKSELFSLIKRGLLDRVDKQPSIDISVSIFSLKKEVIEKIIKSTQEENKKSDAGSA